MLIFFPLSNIDGEVLQTWGESLVSRLPFHVTAMLVLPFNSYSWSCHKLKLLYLLLTHHFSKLSVLMKTMLENSYSPSALLIVKCFSFVSVLRKLCTLLAIFCLCFSSTDSAKN